MHSAKKKKRTVSRTAVSKTGVLEVVQEIDIAAAQPAAKKKSKNLDSESATFGPKSVTASQEIALVARKENIENAADLSQKMTQPIRRGVFAAKS